MDINVQNQKNVRKTKERKAKDAAIQYLRWRERSSGEVRRHLNMKGYNSDEISVVIESLQSNNYINDERYCDYFIKNQIRKGHGPIRIRSALNEKGIDSNQIQDAVHKYFQGDKEREMAMAQGMKAMGVNGGYPNGEDIDEGNREWSSEEMEKQLAKVGRRLFGLGYSFDTIQYVINHLRN